MSNQAPVIAKPVEVVITYGCGSNLENCYSRVTGATQKEVMDEISRVTNGKYSFSYFDKPAYEAMIKTWNLKEVELQPMYPRGGSY